MTANLSDESEKLASATANLTDKDIQDKVMKIFSDPEVLTEKGSVFEVKEEVLYGHGFIKRGTNRRNNGGSRRGYLPGRCSREERKWHQTYSAGKTLVRCYCCQLIKHLIKDCPHKQTLRKFTSMFMLCFSVLSQIHFNLNWFLRI